MATISPETDPGATAGKEFWTTSLGLLAPGNHATPSKTMVSSTDFAGLQGRYTHSEDVRVSGGVPLVDAAVSRISLGECHAVGGCPLLPESQTENQQQHQQQPPQLTLTAKLSFAMKNKDWQIVSYKVTGNLATWMAVLMAKLGTRSICRSLVPVTGHVLFPADSQRSMHALSYVCPVATITGSDINSIEIGQ